MIEVDLLNRLEGWPGLDAFVGSGQTARIYPLNTPERPDFPLILIQRISTTRALEFEGAEPMADTRFQLDLVAEKYIQTRQMSELVRGALHGFSGALGSSFIYSSLLDNEQDDYSDKAGLYRAILDFKIKHQET